MFGLRNFALSTLGEAVSFPLFLFLFFFFPFVLLSRRVERAEDERSAEPEVEEAVRVRVCTGPSSALPAAGTRSSSPHSPAWQEPAEQGAAFPAAH